MLSLEIFGTIAAGLGAGLALIVAIGAQNAFVLRQGLRGDHVGAVVLVCMLSDMVLIAAGIAGIGVLIEAAPAALVVVRFAGAAFLIAYAVMAAVRALKPRVLVAGAPQGGLTFPTAVATAAALTWLNPHVYLDTILLLGSVANHHGDLRWWFGAGAILGSVIWFTALGYGAKLLRPFFATARAWRILDAAIAVTMLALGLSMVIGA